MSDAIDTADDGYYVVRLDTIEPSYVPQLSDIASDVRAVYMREKEALAFQTASEEFVASANENGFETAADLAGYEVITPEDGLSLQALPQDISRSFVASVFNASEGQIIPIPQGDGSLTIVELSKIERLEGDMLNLLAGSGKTALSEQFNSDLQNAFFEALTDEAGVEINQDAISSYISSMAGLE
jgi:hypothetical protein